MDKRSLLKFCLSSTAIMGLTVASSSLYAAKPIDLSQQSVSSLNQFILSPVAAAAKNSVTIKEFNRHVDLNKTHIRVQETYAGYPVFGTDAVIHVSGVVNTPLTALRALQPNQTAMNGVIYDDLARDLGSVNMQTLLAKQTAITQKAIATYQEKNSGRAISNTKSQLMVYVDEANKAHWIYQISFDATPATQTQLPARPVYLIDALTETVYATWDQIVTIKTTESADGGGFGGNKKMGKLIYDGLETDLPKLTMTRDTDTNTCTLENKEVIVKSYKTGKVMSFTCKETDSGHNNVYWWGDQDAVNGGYSPANDALFGAKVIKEMYQNWFGLPVLTQKGKPMLLTMIVHRSMDNAYWDGKQMTFGDGISLFYPLTSLDVAAHEISHGFTQQHADFSGYGEAGGMNEAFSDMASQAAQVYAYGKNTWQLAAEIFKAENEALRYLDQPSKDCKGGKPGKNCSIDSYDQYTSSIDVHYSAGIYNHFFYLLATTEGWDTRKAFEVMLHANMDYWTSRSTFKTAACGVISAAKDLQYDVKAVKDAFSAVKIDTSACK